MKYLDFQGFPSGFIQSLIKLVVTLADQFEIDLPISIEDILAMLPPQISNGEFGIFKGKNATKLDSYYTINNGRYDKSKFLKYEEFNGKTSLPDEWWIDVGPTPSASDSGETGICKDLYGNDGTQFPPFVDKGVRKWLFVGELCRSIWLDFTEDVEVSL